MASLRSHQRAVVATLLLRMLVLIFALHASPLLGCTCADYKLSVREEVAREFREAAAIFEGEVKSIDTHEESGAIFERRIVTLRILEVYKGPSEKTLVVGTGLGDEDCGCNFKVGKKYLVYAFKNPSGRLTTTICDRTRPLWRAVADRRYLNELVQEESAKKKK